MMRGVNSGRAPGSLMLVLGCTALLLACSITPNGAYRGGETVLTVWVEYPAAQSRALLPDLDMVPASFAVSCSGPGEREVETTISGSGARFEKLEPGRWTVDVLALNEGGVAIGEGSAELEVEPAVENAVTVTVGPISGSGALELSLSWPSQLAAQPALEGELTDLSGNSYPLTFTMTGSSASVTMTEVQAGYYTVQIRLLDGGELVGGLADSLRIVSGHTTTGAMDLSSLSGSPGSLDARLVVDMRGPVEMEIAGRQRQMGVGQSLRLASWPAEEGRELTGAWYVDGVLVGRDNSVTVGPELRPGVHRIDLIARDAAREAAGSASFLTEVLADFPSGSLSPSTSFHDGTGAIDGLGGCRSVALSPDGRSLYASGYGDSAIAWFARDEATGMLRFRGAYKEGREGVAGIGGAGPLVLSNDGAYLFAGGSSSGGLALFRRDPANGSLAFLQSRDAAEEGLGGLAGIRSLALSPDGNTLFAAGYTLGAILAFEFDRTLERLTLSQSISRDTAGSELLAGVSSVAVTPDGRQLLATSFDGDSLLVFDRDPVSGFLSFSHSFTDGTAGCDGLNGASGVAVSPDGESVYTCAYYDNSLCLFSRSATTGSLAYVTELTDGAGGVDGLYHAQDIAVSRDGASLYVAASADDGVASFAVSGGSVAYRTLVGGMEGARGLALSADGRNCYVAAAGANALFLLNRRQ